MTKLTARRGGACSAKGCHSALGLALVIALAACETPNPTFPDRRPSYEGTLSDVQVALEGYPTPAAHLGTVVLQSELSACAIEFEVTRETWIGRLGEPLALYELDPGDEVNVTASDLATVECPWSGTAAEIEVRVFAARRPGAR